MCIKQFSLTSTTIYSATLTLMRPFLELSSRHEAREAVNICCLDSHRCHSTTFQHVQDYASAVWLEDVSVFYQSRHNAPKKTLSQEVH